MSKTTAKIIKFPVITRKNMSKYVEDLQNQRLMKANRNSRQECINAKKQEKGILLNKLIELVRGQYFGAGASYNAFKEISELYDSSIVKKNDGGAKRLIEYAYKIASLNQDIISMDLSVEIMEESLKDKIKIEDYKEVTV